MTRNNPAKAAKAAPVAEAPEAPAPVAEAAPVVDTITGLPMATPDPVSPAEAIVAALLAAPEDATAVARILAPLTDRQGQSARDAATTALVTAAPADRLGTMVGTMVAAAALVPDIRREARGTVTLAPVSIAEALTALANLTAATVALAPVTGEAPGARHPLARFLAAAEAIAGDPAAAVTLARIGIAGGRRRAASPEATGTKTPPAPAVAAARRDNLSALDGLPLAVSNGGQATREADGWHVTPGTGAEPVVLPLTASLTAVARAADGRQGASLSGWRDMRTADGRSPDQVVTTG